MDSLFIGARVSRRDDPLLPRSFPSRCAAVERFRAASSDRESRSRRFSRRNDRKLIRRSDMKARSILSLDSDARTPRQNPFGLSRFRSPSFFRRGLAARLATFGKRSKRPRRNVAGLVGRFIRCPLGARTGRSTSSRQTVETRAVQLSGGCWPSVLTSGRVPWICCSCGSPSCLSCRSSRTSSCATASS